MFLRNLILPACLLLCLASCDKNTPVEAAGTEEEKYFSIRQFITDQFQTYKGLPFGIDKTIRFNGEADTVSTNSYDMDWAPVFRLFMDTDISSPPLAGQYRVSLFDDGMGALVQYHEALDPELPVRVCQVRVDKFNNRILSVYIETAVRSFWSEESRKLYYVPMKLIQIQEQSKALLAPEKQLHAEYRFLL